MPSKNCEHCAELIRDRVKAQTERCQRGACLTKDRVIHEGKIVCRYCLRTTPEVCVHPKTSKCTDCDTTNLETV